MMTFDPEEKKFPLVEHESEVDVHLALLAFSRILLRLRSIALHQESASFVNGS
jgi:hypothetical protein